MLVQLAWRGKARRPARARSKRHNLVLDCLALLDPINRTERRHFTVQGHSAQTVQFAHEGERDRMVDEIVAADAATMKGEQMAVEAADDGDEIHGVLDGVGVGCCFLLDRIGTVSDGNSVGHDWLLGFSFKERRGVRYNSLSPVQQPLEFLNIEGQSSFVFVESPPQIGLAGRL